MREATINKKCYGLSLNELIGNDIVRLAYEGELFTTEGKQVTLEYLERATNRERFWDSLSKDVLNNLQTNKVFGYTVPLGLIYGDSLNNDEDVEEVKDYISETLGVYGYYDKEGTFTPHIIELYPYLFEEEEETFESFCEELFEQGCDDGFLVDGEEFTGFTQILESNNVKQFLELQIMVNSEDKNDAYTVKDEIKRFCYDNGKRFTTKFVAKVFNACKEML